jgi:hypothetical protein
VEPVTGVLVQYGAVGVIAIMALAAVRVLFARLSASLDRETQRADRLENELRALNATVRDQYLDTIAKSSEATAAASRAVADALAAVRRG